MLKLGKLIVALLGFTRVCKINYLSASLHLAWKFQSEEMDVTEN